MSAFLTISYSFGKNAPLVEVLFHFILSLFKTSRKNICNTIVTADLRFPSYFRTLMQEDPFALNCFLRFGKD